MLILCDDQHRYTIDGQPVPGVTQVIRDMGLMGTWTNTNQEALERGRIVHKLTELDDAGDLDPESVDPSLEGYLHGWQQFKRETGLEVVAREEMVGSEAYRYAGRLDVRGVIGYRPWILDIKTGKTQPWSVMQLAAYSGCHTDHGRSLHLIGNVELTEDGRYTFVRIDPFDQVRGWGDFLATVRLWHWRNEHGLI